MITFKQFLKEVLVGHEKVYHGTTINQLKALAKNSEEKQARFIYTKDKKLIGADAYHFEHEDMSPFHNWHLAGFVNHSSRDDKYTYTTNDWSKSNGNDDNGVFNINDHPLCKDFEKQGISQKFKKSLNESYNKSPIIHNASPDDLKAILHSSNNEARFLIHPSGKMSCGAECTHSQLAPNYVDHYSNGSLFGYAVHRKGRYYYGAVKKDITNFENSDEVVSNHPTLQNLEKHGFKRGIVQLHSSVRPANKGENLDVYESFAQEKIHKNPQMAALRNLVNNSNDKTVRFVISKTGDWYAGDATKYTHLDMLPHEETHTRGNLFYKNNELLYKFKGPKASAATRGKVEKKLYDGGFKAFLNPFNNKSINESYIQ